jgi:hypothetical protein
MRLELLLLGFVKTTYKSISGCGLSRQIEPAVILL